MTEKRTARAQGTQGRESELRALASFAPLRSLRLRPSRSRGENHGGTEGTEAARSRGGGGGEKEKEEERGREKGRSRAPSGALVSRALCSPPCSLRVLRASVVKRRRSFRRALQRESAMTPGEETPQLSQALRRAWAMTFAGVCATMKRPLSTERRPPSKGAHDDSVYTR